MCVCPCPGSKNTYISCFYFIASISTILSKSGQFPSSHTRCKYQISIFTFSLLVPLFVSVFYSNMCRQVCCGVICCGDSAYQCPINLFKLLVGPHVIIYGCTCCCCCSAFSRFLVVADTQPKNHHGTQHIFSGGHSLYNRVLPCKIYFKQPAYNSDAFLTAGRQGQKNNGKQKREELQEEEMGGEIRRRRRWRGDKSCLLFSSQTCQG